MRCLLFDAAGCEEVRLTLCVHANPPSVSHLVNPFHSPYTAGDFAGKAIVPKLRPSVPGLLYLDPLLAER